MHAEKRGYILRIRSHGSDEDEYVAVGTFTVTEYACGARAGDTLILKRELPVVDESSRVTAVHLPREIWEVLTGAVEDPGTLWLRQPDGELHSWSDDDSLWEYFERTGV